MKKYLVRVNYKDSFGSHGETIEIEAACSSDALLEGTGMFASQAGTFVLSGSVHPIADYKEKENETTRQEVQDPNEPAPSEKVPSERLLPEEIDGV